jgi:hypothetical protein
METYEDKAIEAVKNFLIYLLQESNFCKARTVGRALEALINSKESLLCEQQIQPSASTGRAL